MKRARSRGLHRHDPKDIAMNAAGIADAFRCCQLADDDGDNRWQEIAECMNGWVGVVARIAEAGAIMEAYRAERNATWGDDLPFLYEVWDEIARSLWDRIEAADFDTLVRRAITRAEVLDPTLEP